MTDKTKAWVEGYHLGEESVFEYLNEMFWFDISALKEDYESWCEADEYTNKQGQRINRLTGVVK